MSVSRWDRATFEAPEKTPAGYLRADAVLTRAGVFAYRDANGNLTRELRKPSEVFRKDSISTLELAPLVNEHPDERVDASNIRKYQIGSVGEQIVRDGALVKSRLVITDQETIDEVERGGKREISCGYTCDVEAETGVYDGERYDAVQKNIVYNHVALVRQGRAGPEVRIRLDSGAAIMTIAARKNRTDAPPDEMEDKTKMKEADDDESSEPKMVKGGAGSEPQKTSTMKIGDNEYEVASDVKDAIEQWMKDAATKLGSKDLDMDALKAKADSLAEQVKKLKTDKADPSKFQEALKARRALENSAVKILGDEIKLDEMDDTEIKKAVIQKVSPEAKLDGVSPAYLQGRFDHAVESSGGNEFSSFAARVSGGEKKDSGAQHLDAAAAAKAKFQERNQNAWKTFSNGKTKNAPAA